MLQNVTLLKPLVPKTYDIKGKMISLSIISKENFTTQYYLHNKIIFL